MGKRLVGMMAGALLLAPGSALGAQRSDIPPVPNLAGKILTVQGPIDPAQAGQTLMHEHIFINFRAPERVGSWVSLPRPPQSDAGRAGQAQGQQNQQGQRGAAPAQPARGSGRGSPGWNLLDNFDEQLAEVMEFRKAGGGTIVDVTNFGLSRDPVRLKRMSEATGLNVVMGAGWYQKALHPPDMSDRTVDELTDIIVRDVVVGAQGTDIRSGVIGEIGVQGRPITENEIKSIRASARASRLTGAPMTFHMGGGTQEEKQQTLDLVAAEGVDLSHVVMGHNGSGDVAVMRRITDRGAYIEFDYIGDAPAAPDSGASLRQAAERRAQQIKTLIDAGLTDRIVIAHDVCTQPQLLKNGGGGFGFTSNLVIPALKALGVSDSDIHKIMVDNPRRVLTFVAPQPLLVPAKPDFSGTWALDAARSDPPFDVPDLQIPPDPPSIAIQQSATEIVIDEGQGKATFKLDGSESTNPGMGGAALVTKTTWDGNAIVTSGSFNAGGMGTVQFRNTRTLSADGKVLMIDTWGSMEMGEGARRIVYTKSPPTP